MKSRKKILIKSTPLGRSLAEARFGERHARLVNAPIETVWRTLHELQWSELPLTRLLMAVRSGGRQDASLPTLQAPDPDMPRIEEAPKYAASAAVGRPWQLRPTAGPRIPDLASLSAFTEPGWLKYGMEWLLTPLPGDRTLLETATLCEATDEASRRRFAPYWAVIGAFSGLIRSDVLRGVARAAEN